MGILFRTLLLALACATALAPAVRAGGASGNGPGGEGSGGIELVMVEQPGCHWCEMWNRQISAIYPKTAEGAFAPLRREQLAEVRKGGGDVAPVRAVTFTPTFLLVSGGVELARIEGYPGEDFFWGLLDMMLARNTAYSAPQS